nr:serine/threonine-protein kinase ATR [Tanacetum cinerariifolium]
MANLSSLVHELRERIAASSSTPPNNNDDDASLELRFRAVIPNLLHTYVIPSSSDHGFTVVNSYQRPPLQVMTTIEDISEPGTSHEYKTDKMLLTWHNSTPDKDFVCDSVTPKSLPQHDSSTPGKYSVCESITPRKLSFEETELDGEVGFGDVVGSGIDSSGLSHDKSFRVDDLDLNVNLSIDLSVSQTETQAEVFVSEVLVFEEEAIEAPSDEQVDYDVEGIDIAYETQYHVESSEDACTDDDDDDDLLVYEENEIVELDVDVHLFSISKDVCFDNIVTLKFASVKENKDGVYLHFIESGRILKLYKNDNIMENIDVGAERHENWTSKRTKL